ncbi:hypothetical protein [Halapricum hydrolyticum]|uniref:Uncharacterized protein n=1 Tax=Halapricum hydrolyticum TaxID=2979991 RepID=A0AAE3IA55_9EURY|nr:hypothetical protein [Halapricum hydrolyticum]MCU4717723.1 hypothetical protein [Halapricum hydrolyticum]MCU4726748.1 hypothetical protein [Halapricum hydrolyticum]
MSAEETYVPGVVWWLIVATVVGLVLVAAFWRPEAAVTRPDPFGLDERTWVEGVAYGVLTLSLLYALAPTAEPAGISPLAVSVFVIVLAALVETGQALSGVATFQVIDLTAAIACSVGVALVWDAGRRALRMPPA